MKLKGLVLGLVLIFGVSNGWNMDKNTAIDPATGDYPASLPIWEVPLPAEFHDLLVSTIENCCNHESLLLDQGFCLQCEELNKYIVSKLTKRQYYKCLLVFKYTYLNLEWATNIVIPNSTFISLGNKIFNSRDWTEDL